MTARDAAQPAASAPFVHPPVDCQQVAESRRLIQAAAESAHAGRAIVLGAGRCTEIPLAKLLGYFEAVTVNDCCRADLEQGIAAAQLPPKDRDRLAVQCDDLTGSQEVLLGGIQAAVDKAPSIEAAIDDMARRVEAAPLAGMTRGTHQYDLVVASCVLSQLHLGVLNGASRALEARFPGAQPRLLHSARWTAAMYDLARRMERKFIDDLAGILAPGGLIYLSDSVRMCHVERTAAGQWQTAGTYRMLHTPALADYLDRRFVVVARGRWHWVDGRPVEPGQSGRLYDVQALVLRCWRA